MHGNNRHERRKRLVGRCEVKAYVAPNRMVQIAAERTDGMADYFLLVERDVRNFSDDLRALARSAYMQGVHDMLDIIGRGQSEIERLAPTPPSDARAKE